MFADTAIHTAVTSPAAISLAVTVPTFDQGRVHLHFELLDLLNSAHGFHKAPDALNVRFLRCFFHSFTTPHKRGCFKMCIQVYKLIYFACEYISMKTSVVIPDMDTTIRLSTDTRDKLVEIGRKNESYDALIIRLVEHWKKTSPK